MDRQHLLRRSHLLSAFDVYPLQPGLAYTMAVPLLKRRRRMPYWGIATFLHTVAAEYGPRDIQPLSWSTVTHPLYFPWTGHNSVDLICDRGSSGFHCLTTTGCPEARP